MSDIIREDQLTEAQKLVVKRLRKFLQLGNEGIDTDPDTESNEIILHMAVSGTGKSRILEKIRNLSPPKEVVYEGATGFQPGVLYMDELAQYIIPNRPRKSSHGVFELMREAIQSSIDDTGFDYTRVPTPRLPMLTSHIPMPIKYEFIDNGKPSYKDIILPIQDFHAGMNHNGRNFTFDEDFFDLQIGNTIYQNCRLHNIVRNPCIDTDSNMWKSKMYINGEEVITEEIKFNVNIPDHLKALKNRPEDKRKNKNPKHYR